MRHLALLMLFAAAACHPSPAPPPPPADADVPDSDAEARSSQCAQACAHWAALGCPQAYPQVPGRCKASCENAQASGLVTWKMQCRITVRSCDAIDLCEK